MDYKSVDVFGKSLEKLRKRAKMKISVAFFLANPWLGNSGRFKYNTRGSMRYQKIW